MRVSKFVQTHSFASRRSTFILLLLAALGLLLADSVMLALHSGRYSMAIGNFRDEYFVEGVHRQEVAQDGKTYRWTEAQSRLWLNEIGVGDYSLLTLDLGGRPEAADVQLSLRGKPWLNFTAQSRARNYSFLLPHDINQQIWIDIHSPTFEVAGDPRQLGIKLQGFTITNFHHTLPLPPAGQYLNQMLILVLILLISMRLGWQWPVQALLLTLLIIGMAFLLSNQLLVTMNYFQRLMVATAVMALLSWLVLPLLEHWVVQDSPFDKAMLEQSELYFLWSLMLGGWAIRMIGVLYPSFGGQDLGRNLNRLMATMHGQLYIIAPSSEFAKGLTIYPTGPYLALMPGVLATGDTAALMQGGLALMDSLTAFLTGILAYKLGANRHAARMATLLYAGNIAAFGAMSYSFSAQIFGQWFSVALALFLLSREWPPKMSTWLLAMLIMLFGVFSHIGVAILGMAWMGFILLLTTVIQRRIPWWGCLLFMLAGLLAFAFLYVEIMSITLQHAAEKVVPESIGSGTLLKGWSILLLNGMRIGYSDIGLALLIPGLLLFVRQIRKAAKHDKRWIVPVAWLLTALFFLGVDLLLNVQVRYFYFALPLVLALIALPLGWLAGRLRFGQILAWGIVLLIIVPQIMLWLSATWADGKIPMTPLTH